MRVSCGCPKSTASSALLDDLAARGIEPIITNTIIRVVYEGPNVRTGEYIVQRFSEEEGCDLTVFYDGAKQTKAQRRRQRKAKRKARGL